MKNTGKIHKSLRKIPLGGNNVRRKPIRGLLFVFFFFPFILSAQLLTPDATQNIENYLNSEVSKEISVGKIRIDSTKIAGNELHLFINGNFSNFPFRNHNAAKFKIEMMFRQEGLLA